MKKKLRNLLVMDDTKFVIFHLFTNAFTLYFDWGTVGFLNSPDL